MRIAITRETLADLVENTLFTCYPKEMIELDGKIQIREVKGILE